MAIKKPAPEKPGKTVSSLKKGEKVAPKSVAKVAVTKPAVKAAPDPKPISKKPAVKEATKVVTKAPVKAVAAVPEKNVAGKTHQTPSDTVKEKTNTTKQASNK